MSQAFQGARAVLKKAPSDVVIVCALRTPITRSFKGGLRNAHPEQMLSAVLQEIPNRVPELNISEVKDVVVGTVLSELGGSKLARMALNHVGYPSSTAVATVNRACGSSLQAIASIADSISVGRIDVGIGAGMESMSQNYATKAIPTAVWSELRESPVQSARDCLMPMGMTSEIIARRYGVSRNDQDAFALNSHLKASKAQREGLFEQEIVPLKVVSNSDNSTSIIDKDDGIRHNISMEKLSKLKPAFAEDGSSTAGNSSQISDGAAAAVLMRRDVAYAMGLRGNILGKWAASTVVGVEPDEMGIGPAVAIPKLLATTGLSVNDIDVWEINEAFASQALYCIRKLELDIDKVNPNGGAISLGHPLGATGARQLATMVPGMYRQQHELGVISMCVGTGMGVSALVVRE